MKKIIRLLIELAFLSIPCCAFGGGAGPTPAQELLTLQEIYAVPGDSVFEQWKKTSFENWRNRPAGKEMLEALISNLLHFYSENGFPFAEISPALEEAGGGRADVRLQIVSGPEVHLSQISFGSFSSGEQKQLARMLCFLPGVFDERDIQLWKEKAGWYPDLVWKGEAKISAAPDFSSARLEVPLARRSRNLVEGAFGYFPSGAESGPFGEISIQLVTLGKIGREVGFYWHRPNSKSRLLSLRYQDFFFGPAPFYLSGRLAEEEKQEQYFKLYAESEILALLAGKWRGGLNFGYERITPRVEEGLGDSGRAAARQYLLGARLKLGEKELAEKTFFITLEGKIARKKVFSAFGIKSGVPTQVGLEAGGAFKMAPAWGLYLTGKGEAKFFPSFLFTPSDLYYLGGYGTLRGYPDESVVAQRYLLGRAEPRFCLGENNFLFGFFDCGYFFRAKSLPGPAVSNRFKPAAGFGLSAGAGHLILAFGWAEKAKLKDGIGYLRLSGEL